MERIKSGTATPTARTAKIALREGALFYNDAKGDHFCSAGVVDSPHKNLLITAAHCIHGGKGGSYNKNVVFVPEYRNGNTPYGVWTTKLLLVDDRWAKSSDPDFDVGFISVEPNDGKNIADVLGANSLGIDLGFTHIVRVVGYPSSSDVPIACINKTSQQSASQLRFACGGYFGGTSGSPWLTRFDPKTRTGQIVGVIGGYQEGGKTDSVSYSSYFGDDIKKLYDRAVSMS
jgi:V8-like Glu-specific endopeptidase